MSWTKTSTMGPFVLAAMVCALSAAFLFEWRASRSSAESLSASVGRTLKAFEHETEVLSSRLGGVGNSLSGVEETLLEEKGLLLQIEGLLKESLGAEKGQTGPNGAVAEPASLSPLEDVGFRFDAKDLEGLPPLPEGLRPESFLDAERLADFVTQFRGDPERRLDNYETAKASNILAESRARVELLKSRIQLTMYQAAQKLKERGDYVDYARGESYHSEPGVMTFGEDLQERGMRIFYLFPEEFPEIYAMTDETKRLSELGIRRLLQLVNGGGEAKGTKGG